MEKKRRLTSTKVTDNTGNRSTTKSSLMPTISSFEDVAGSEDEFQINRDKINIDQAPGTNRKRRFQEEDDSFVLSDEEIFEYPDSSSEEDLVNSRNGSHTSSHEASGLELATNEDLDEENEGWGTSKQDYYNHDHIETEAHALEEEAEAKRLQHKKLSKMSVVDFNIEEDDWLYNNDEKKTGDVVTEVLQDVEITADTQSDERLRILKLRYPEFEPLANDLLELYPVLQQLQNQVENETTSLTSAHSSTLLKFRALSAYVGALTMYFAIFSSPGYGSAGETHALSPIELQEHPIMDSLLKCRELWSKTKDYNAPTPTITTSKEDYICEVSKEPAQDITTKTGKKIVKELKRPTIAARSARQANEVEKELQDLTNLIKIPFKKDIRTKLLPATNDEDSDGSDFGEEDSMDAKSATEKVHNKRSLRFYTSKITQKANKRIGAGRNAGGDEDIPHRERLRDRQARLNSEAQRRAMKHDVTDLGEKSESDEGAVAMQVRDTGDEYYDLVTRAANQKKDQKIALKQAEAQAKAEGGFVRRVESEIGENGKRAIGYVIEKNKGLAPKRKKDVRNPRVKKRKKFEEKKKKLASTRAVYKGGEERGGYGGEKTGIKTRLVKSIKL